MQPAIVIASEEHADELLDEFGRYRRDYDLRAVRSSNVLFITTPERVKERGLADDGPTNPGQISPFFPALGGGFNAPPGVIGGGIFVPGGGVAPPAIDPAPLPEPANPPPAPDKPAQAPPSPPVEKKP